jgi:hypothetical protein
MALRVSPSKSSVKIIHYCWFGPKIPLETADRIRRWQKLHPSWELRRWDEKNIDLQGCPYAEARLRDKEWSYLSDYVRLQALSLEGGVYLDADVEVLKPIDSFLDDLLHVGYMHNCALGTAVIISPPAHYLLQNLVRFYQALPAGRGINNNAILTEYFLGNLAGFKLDGRNWLGLGLQVHGSTWFEPPTLFRKGGFCVHLFNRAWDSRTRGRKSGFRPSPGLLFVWKRRLRAIWEQAQCYYLPIYLRDRYGFPFLPQPSLHTLRARV